MSYNNIIRIPHTKNCLPAVRHRMRTEGFSILLCETNGLSHINYYMCRNQHAADGLLDANSDSCLWYVSDADAPIRLSIDFDYKTIDNHTVDMATAALDLFASVKEKFEGNIVGIADRSGFNADKSSYKFSKRLYTDLVFDSTPMLQLYMKEFVAKHGYDRNVVDLSIYSKNRLYPVIERNSKNGRSLAWEQGSGFALCDPNNADGTKVKVEIPKPVLQRQEQGQANIKAVLQKPSPQFIDAALFLDLLDSIPSDHWDTYSEWLKLGSFCKTYFNFEVFHDISKQSLVNHADESDCRKLYDQDLLPIHPGYIVNVAKQTLEANALIKVYGKHRFVKSTLTEKSIARQCVFYLGDQFRMAPKQPWQWHRVFSTTKQAKQMFRSCFVTPGPVGGGVHPGTLPSPPA